MKHHQSQSSPKKNGAAPQQHPGANFGSNAQAQALLKRGSKGPQVGVLQRALNRQPVPATQLTIDEHFGGNTEEGLKQFQADAGLSPNGQAGPSTQSALTVETGGSSQVSPPAESSTDSGASTEQGTEQGTAPLQEVELPQTDGTSPDEGSIFRSLIDIAHTEWAGVTGFLDESVDSVLSWFDSTEDSQSTEEGSIGGGGAHGRAQQVIAASLTQAQKSDGITPAVAQKPPMVAPATPPKTETQLVSAMPADLAKQFADCKSLASKDKLSFPGRGTSATQAPYRSLIRAYKKWMKSEYGQGERRINKEIVKIGGGKAKAYYINDYISSRIVSIDKKYDGRGGRKLLDVAATSLTTMGEAAAKDSVPIRVLSAYRKPKNKKSSNPSAVASNSAHSYGLAIDLKLSVDDADFKVTEISTKNAENLMKMFDSPVHQWMIANGAKFNWHPYANEPWHFEYNPEGMAQEIVDGAKAHS